MTEAANEILTNIGVRRKRGSQQLSSFSVIKRKLKNGNVRARAAKYREVNRKVRLDMRTGNDNWI